MATISVCLICCNEAHHLPRWLEAVKPFADQIVAVDSGSSDDTMSILEQAGAKVRFHEFTGYSDQRNFAATLCTGDWIFCLDGDEFVDAGLADELNRMKNGPEPKESAFRVLGRVHFFGRLLRHGGFFPEKKLRLHKRGRAHWARNEVHERLEVDGEIGKLEDGYIDHYSYDSVIDYIARMRLYSEMSARYLHMEGKQTNWFKAWSHSWWNFFNRFVLRAGFLDGYEGFLAAKLESVYTLVKYSRLREMNRENGR